MNLTKLQLFISIFLILIFTCALIFRPETYDVLSQEDGIIESIGALCLLFTSMYIFQSMWIARKSKNLGKGLIVLFFIAGVVFFLAAGEEISWGQRIFGFSTPHELSEINDQNEFNFHNINKKFFDRLFDRGILGFVSIGLIMILIKKKTIGGIPTPTSWTLIALILAIVYRENYFIKLDFYHLAFLLLLIFSVMVIATGHRNDLWIIVIVLITVITMIASHSAYLDHFPFHKNSGNEFRETLCSLNLFFYALYVHRFLLRTLYR